MRKDTLDKVLNELSHSSVDEVVVGGIGEPLMSPYWKETVQKLKEAGKKVILTTNGTLINEDVAGFLIDFDVDEIYISVETSSFGHNNVENTLRVGDMMKQLKQEKGNTNPILSAEVVLTRSSLQSDIELVKTLGKHGVRYVLLNNLLPVSGSLDHEMLYEKDRTNNDLWHMLSLQFYNKVAVEYPEFSVRTERLCRFVERRSMVISSEGDVSPCYRFLHDGGERVFGREKRIRMHSFGNVNEKTLSEIWNSPDYVIYRFKVHYAIFPSCADCFLRNGCGFLFNADADCWGNMPSCGDCLWYRQIILCP
jgi:radical SAM protein with 4Fe4S-binding SPASM domain